jgi:catechol 2,3-dioxygenase-like lactoylglutathione lyase family enzyme
MRFEHFALNVSEPNKMADWYVSHCRMRVVRSTAEAPFTHFLADEGGRVVLEIYRNPKASVPDYAGRHPLEFHFALAVSDAEAVKERLIEAGAVLVEEVKPADGSHLVMLRDPFGVPLQLCQRSQPF